MTASDPLAFCAHELASLDTASLRRRVRPLSSAQEPLAQMAGRSVLLLASNNYLGLATHPTVVEAAASAARRWGAGSGSARLITGGTTLHDELEAALADLKGTDDAILFSSGYLANVGTIDALLGPGDAMFSDALNHASIIDGARLARAEVHVYRHADPAHLEALIAAWRRNHPRARALVVSDSVFSMDGDLAPLPALVEICERHGSMLMIDEAHATGVVGPGGHGAVQHFGIEGRVPIVMGTLSKALGSAGGFIAGSRDLCDYLRNRCRTYIFDTALPAPSTAAALQAIRVLAAEPELATRARALASTLAGSLRELGYDTIEPEAAIVPVRVGEAAAALRLAQDMLERGVLVPAIRPPTVPEGTARLRATVMATFTDEQLACAVQAFASSR